jgi:hypothetical protein
MESLIRVDMSELFEIIDKVFARVGLKQSDLYKTIKIDKNVDSVVLLAPDYINFVDSGRKPGKIPPAKDIKE